MNPILFDTRYFTIHTLWVMIALGLLTTTYTLIRLSIKNRLKLRFLSQNGWKLIFWGIVGARAGFIIENFYLYFTQVDINSFLRILAIWDKGLNTWSGLLAVTIAVYYACKEKEQEFWKWLDVLVPSVIIGLAFYHIGAFFEGINYGHETSLPWGTNFESPSIKYAVPIHPTQFYAFIYSAIWGTALILMNQTKKIQESRQGTLALIGIIGYSLLKFLEEFMRGDDTWMVGDIRLPQIITLVFLISASIFTYLRYNEPTKNLAKKKNAVHKKSS